MYITDEILIELKYSRTSPYVGWRCSKIFLAEYKQNHNNRTFLEYGKKLFHRLLDEKNDIWQLNFPDKSFILIKYIGDNEYAHEFQPMDFENVNIHFNDIKNE